ncbi:MAG: patatin-related protein [Paracoccaceae bacterium]|jgi:patatin-related protein
MKELRIGLVLYGGVALAVYINGVVTEIWHALRASRAMQDGEDTNLDSTSEIYRDLLAELKETADTDELRIVVDAVAGTSAGGVNGAALFKAIVQGADASVLNDVWLDDADIKNLQGDPDRLPWYLRAAENMLRIFPTLKKLRSNLREQTTLEWTWIRDTIYTLAATKDPQKSPLKGDFFTTIIAASLRRMSENKKSEPLLPTRGTFDLFLTRTDLHGWPRHLPVSRRYHPTDLYERTHAHVMAYRVRFGDPPSKISDFELTYGARTTAGFPLAFAPVTYKEIRQNFLEAQPSATPPSDDEFTNTYLREHHLSGFDTSKARMVDGGVLDNRPFTHVTRAIEAKPADFEVRRIVAYIEPDPEREIDAAPDNGPLTKDMLGNMFRLFRNEPILGDLRELQKRNETVSRILEFQAANAPVTDAFINQVAGNLDGEITEGRLNDWRRDANARLRADPMSGYLGYVGLKLRSASNVYADIACRALNLPYESRHAFAVRRIVRLWMTGQPENILDPLSAQQNGLSETLTENQITLLQAFDIPFRLRRIRAIVKTINAEYDHATDRSGLDACKRGLADIVCRYEVAMTDTGDDLQQIERIVEDDIDTLLDVLAGQPETIVAQYGEMLAGIFDAVAGRFRNLGVDENRNIAEAIMLLPEEARRRVARALIAFPYNDVMIYPLMETAGVTDPVPVETLRISPYDARIVGDRITPLESAGFGAFKGFLSRRLREIDLLYGRLNGIERMVDLIINTAAKDPASPAMQERRQRYTAAAMARALDEADAAEKTDIKPLVAELRKKLDAYGNQGGLVA